MSLRYNEEDHTWDSGGSFGQQSRCKQCVSAKYKTMAIIVGSLGLAICVCLLGFLVFSESPNLPSESVKTLKLTSILFRHGARTPTSTYNSDPYKNYPWPGGLGSLTNVGKTQLYDLGKKLRKQYNGFLPEEYLDSDVYIVSSDIPRTLSSASTLLAGLYPPIPSQQWNSNLAWQPIPVHSIPRNIDMLLGMKKSCKVADDHYVNARKLPAVKDKYLNLFNNLTFYCNQSMQDVLPVELLYSTLMIQKEHGLKLPEWTKEFFPIKMREPTCSSFEVFTYDTLLKRLRAGPLLSEILTNMKQKQTGILKPDRKMFLYSGHDVTIVSLLRTLGFDQECILPDYSAALIIELHSIPETLGSEVKLIYYNSSAHEPHPLKIPNCGDPCTLEEFENITLPVIPQDWEEECKFTASRSYEVSDDNITLDNY